MKQKTNPTEDKGRLLAELTEVRRQLLEVASSLPAPQRDVIFLGVWSVKDVLAHLAGWDDTNLEATRELIAGRLPGFYAYRDRDWQTYNARLVGQYKRDDFEELLDLVCASQRRLLDYLQSLPAEAFDIDRCVRFKGYKVTIGRLLRAELSDEQTHLAQLLEFSHHKPLHSP